jgi:hypothetical protein
MFTGGIKFEIGNSLQFMKYLRIAIILTLVAAISILGISFIIPDSAKRSIRSQFVYAINGGQVEHYLSCGDLPGTSSVRQTFDEHREVLKELMKVNGNKYFIDGEEKELSFTDSNYNGSRLDIKKL